MANDVVSRHDFSTCCDFDPVSDARSFLLVLVNTEEKDAKKMSLMTSPMTEAAPIKNKPPAVSAISRL